MIPFGKIVVVQPIQKQQALGAAKKARRGSRAIDFVCESIFNTHMYKPSEFAEKVGVTVPTLQRWDREGRLIAKRTHTNRRCYTDEDLQ